MFGFLLLPWGGKMLWELCALCAMTGGCWSHWGGAGAALAVGFGALERGVKHQD